MNGKPGRQTDEPDWARLNDAEHRLDEEIAQARREARMRVAAARTEAAATAPDPAATAALAAAQERADLEQHASDLARLAADAEVRVQRLDLATDALVESLAQWVLDAALAEAVPQGQA